MQLPPCRMLQAVSAVLRHHPDRSGCYGILVHQYSYVAEWEFRLDQLRRQQQRRWGCQQGCQQGWLPLLNRSSPDWLLGGATPDGSAGSLVLAPSAVGDGGGPPPALALTITPPRQNHTCIPEPVSGAAGHPSSGGDRCSAADGLVRSHDDKHVEERSGSGAAAAAPPLAPQWDEAAGLLGPVGASGPVVPGPQSGEGSADGCLGASGGGGVKGGAHLRADPGCGYLDGASSGGCSEHQRTRPCFNAPSELFRLGPDGGHLGVLAAKVSGAGAAPPLQPLPLPHVGNTEHHFVAC
jgi:hypothetical protein